MPRCWLSYLERLEKCSEHWRQRIRTWGHSGPESNVLMVIQSKTDHVENHSC